MRKAVAFTLAALVALTLTFSSEAAHAGPAYYGADVSSMNKDRVLICDHTHNGKKATVVWEDAFGVHQKTDRGGADGRCGGHYVQGKGKWHKTCDSPRTNHCGRVSYH